MHNIDTVVNQQNMNTLDRTRKNKVYLNVVVWALLVTIALFVETKKTTTTNNIPTNYHFFPALVNGFQHGHATIIHNFHHHSSRKIIKRQLKCESFYQQSPILSITSSPPLSYTTTQLASKSIRNEKNNINHNDNRMKSWRLHDHTNDGNHLKMDCKNEDFSSKMNGSSFMKNIREFGSTFMIMMMVMICCVPSMDSTWAMEESNSNRNKPYYTIMSEGTLKERQEANYALLDYAVGTINTQFYDPTAGANFAPQDLYHRFQQMRSYTAATTNQSQKKKFNNIPATNDNKEDLKMPIQALDDRDNAIDGLKWLVSTLQDPYSKYLTRQELLQEHAPATTNNYKYNSYNEFLESHFGVLIGKTSSITTSTNSQTSKNHYHEKKTEIIATTPHLLRNHDNKNNNNKNNDGYYHYNYLMLSPKRNTMIQSLPMVTAVIPDSIAERNGIIVGDRIVAIGNDSFLDSHKKPSEIAKLLSHSIDNNNQELTIAVARPVLLPPSQQQQPLPPATNTAYRTSSSSATDVSPISSLATKDVFLGYRLSHVHIHSYNNNDINDDDSKKDCVKNGISSSTVVAGGNAVVRYQLLTPEDSLFVPSDENIKKVGYIRLTRFSRTATAGYIDAVQKLEQAGAQSYIIDVRNNYGGIIQEAFLTASTLLRDPHMVLSYTMNSRGGFAPNDVQQYIIDSRYPGHLLSKMTVPTDIQKDLMFAAATRHEWAPPSSYASLREQSIKYGIHRPTSASSNTLSTSSSPLGREKDLVVLINEGTASSAEVFASALHDNGRLVALVGAKTYGKGLIQHTFPMPDGGGLRLTVGEYLTPSLHHVTKVGGARYNDQGDLIGGGIHPDILCPSNHGISSNVGADLCVGMALDALQQHESLSRNPTANSV